MVLSQTVNKFGFIPKIMLTYVFVNKYGFRKNVGILKGKIGCFIYRTKIAGFPNGNTFFPFSNKKSN